ncbi:MAG: hypothetical protein HQL07_02705 [Nitrospirae bacterium]|nr:hypothetical protein [Magnetococcales bacterium]HAT50701.1 hypothetical protein [Alphaproteobacteria bacterium]
MNDTTKFVEPTRIAGKRKHLRASTRESATLLLEGIGEIVGHADDIGFGGVFFTSEMELDAVPVGSTGTISFTMFNTLVDLNCRVASSRDDGLGIEIQRCYSTDDLKERVKDISREKPPEKGMVTHDAIQGLLYQTSAFLRQLANPAHRGYSHAEAELLADKTDMILSSLDGST